MVNWLLDKNDHSGDSMIQPHFELGFPQDSSQLGTICDSCFGFYWNPLCKKVIGSWNHNSTPIPRHLDQVPPFFVHSGQLQMKALPVYVLPGTP